MGSRAATEDLAKIRDQKDQADILILDFSKAFDTVSHRHLIHKLRHSDIDSLTVNWIENWFQSRKQLVLLDRIKSKQATVRSGVPQGTACARTTSIPTMHNRHRR